MGVSKMWVFWGSLCAVSHSFGSTLHAPDCWKVLYSQRVQVPERMGKHKPYEASGANNVEVFAPPRNSHSCTRDSYAAATVFFCALRIAQDAQGEKKDL